MTQRQVIIHIENIMKLDPCFKPNNQAKKKKDLNMEGKTKKHLEDNTGHCITST
jgi:hypothetical protein